MAAVYYQQTRDKVGKRQEDKMTGALGVLAPRKLQIKTPIPTDMGECGKKAGPQALHCLKALPLVLALAGGF